VRTLRSLPEVKAACREAARAGTLGFVPTMGALHEGHLSLVRRAVTECDVVAASVYVNPLQFGPDEDFEAYPRDEQGDARRLEQAGCGLLLMLSDGEMYPDGFATRIAQPELTAAMEGECRPGHFEGVLTVVAKLLNIVAPARAYFGHKDFQQSVVIRRLVADLDMPVEVVVCPTVRDPDGMAMSSRNAYLSPGDRARGLSLVDALSRAQELFAAGEDRVDVLEAEMTSVLTSGLEAEPQYARVVEPVRLTRPERAHPGHVALVAGEVGPTRLIDNHVLGATIGPFARG
jgi:pantoate--beta-alanine ligase